MERARFLPLLSCVYAPDRPSDLGPKPSAEVSSQTLEEAFERKRQQILEGAEAVFLSHGYEGSSMSQIAQRSGVSKGTLYNHFENKASLFGAVIDDLSRNKLVPILQKSDEPSDFPEALIAMAENFIRFLISPGPLQLYRVIVAEAPRFPDIANIFFRYGFGFLLNHFVKQFEEWSQRGVLQIDDTCFAAEQFMALCQTRLVQRIRLNLEVDCSDERIHDIAQRIATTFLRIYAPL